MVLLSHRGPVSFDRDESGRRTGSRSARHAQMQWLPGLSHVPISDDPRLVASLMLRFLKTATEDGERDRTLPAAPVSSRVPTTRPTIQSMTRG